MFGGQNHIFGRQPGEGQRLHIRHTAGTGAQAKHFDIALRLLLHQSEHNIHPLRPVRKSLLHRLLLLHRTGLGRHWGGGGQGLRRVIGPFRFLRRLCRGLGRMFLPRFFCPFQCLVLGLLFLQLLFQRAPNGFRQCLAIGAGHLHNRRQDGTLPGRRGRRGPGLRLLRPLCPRRRALLRRLRRLSPRQQVEHMGGLAAPAPLFPGHYRTSPSVRRPPCGIKPPAISSHSASKSRDGLERGA